MNWWAFPPLAKRTRASAARCSNLEVNKARGAKVQRRRTFYHDMKRIFFALMLLALWLPAWQPVKAADVSVDFFYNNLSGGNWIRSEEHTSELQSLTNLVCRLLLEKKNNTTIL